MEAQLDQMEEGAGNFNLLLKFNRLPDEDIHDLCDVFSSSIMVPFKCVNNTMKNLTDLSHGQQLRQAHDHRLCSGSLNSSNNNLKPIILVPGIGGSSLEARLHKNTSPHWYCFKKWNWFRIWLALSELTVQDCWFDNLNVHYDPNTGDFHNTPGVQIRPKDFGGLDGIDYLDKTVGLPIAITNVFGDMIKFFKDLGYTDSNLRGAPYDWRMPIGYLETDGWFTEFRHLVEDTYLLNGKQKVVLICHSMGGLIMLHFLNQVNEEWRSKYVDSFVPISTPWSGSPAAYRSMISGDDFGIKFMKWKKQRDFARQSGAVAQLLPTNMMYNDNHVFISSRGTHYTMSQTSELFENIGMDKSAEIYKKNSPQFNELDPKIRTFCLYGGDIKTEVHYDYYNGFHSQPSISYSMEGDGTVPLESLRTCHKWLTQSEYKVEIQTFRYTSHLDMLSNKDVLTYLYRVASNQI